MIVKRDQEVLSRLRTGPVTGAEIGVWRGRMSEALLSRSDLSLYMIDNWEGLPELAHLGYGASQQPSNKVLAIQRTDFAKDRRHVLQSSSVDAANDIEDGSLDFVFIDADHSYEGVSADIKAWRQKVRRGGLLCGHDYNNKNIKEGVEVKQAVDEAVREHNFTLETGKDSTWFVRI